MDRQRSRRAARTDWRGTDPPAARRGRFAILDTAGRLDGGQATRAGLGARVRGGLDRALHRIAAAGEFVARRAEETTRRRGRPAGSPKYSAPFTLVITPR